MLLVILHKFVACFLTSKTFTVKMAKLQSLAAIGIHLNVFCRLFFFYSGKLTLTDLNFFECAVACTITDDLLLYRLFNINFPHYPDVFTAVIAVFHYKSFLSNSYFNILRPYWRRFLTVTGDVFVI